MNRLLNVVSFFSLKIFYFIDDLNGSFLSQSYKVFQKLIILPIGWLVISICFLQNFGFKCLVFKA